MTWELYEVWAEDESGHEELVDTTKSIKEARQLAKRSLGDWALAATIYKETGDGDYEVVEEVKR